MIDTHFQGAISELLASSILIQHDTDEYLFVCTYEDLTDTESEIPLLRAFCSDFQPNLCLYAFKNSPFPHWLKCLEANTRCLAFNSHINYCSPHSIYFVQEEQLVLPKAATLLNYCCNNYQIWASNRRWGLQEHLSLLARTWFLPAVYRAHQGTVYLWLLRPHTSYFYHSYN